MLDMEAQKLKIGSVSKLDALKTKIEWEPESLKLVVVIEAWTRSWVSRKKKRVLTHDLILHKKYK